MKPTLICLESLAILFIFLPIAATAQSWSEIVPLRSTCDDVKRSFKVKKCDIPVSNYSFGDFSANITFSSGRDRWKVRKGTVVGLIITFQRLQKLHEVVPDLNGFVVVPVDDLPNAKIYKNKKTGMSINVQKILSNSDEEFVTGISLYPREPTRKN